MYITKRKNTMNLFDEMTNLFNDTFINRGKLLKTDILDQGDNYLFTIDVPGIDKKDLSITLEEGYLIVKYETTSSMEDANYIQKERFVQSASRSYYVGDIKEDSIQAKLDNGVLFINVPKIKDSECKKCISIE